MRLSHPIWVRGLKYLVLIVYRFLLLVASYMGAWIEIFLPISLYLIFYVASYMGAWIEIVSEL